MAARTGSGWPQKPAGFLRAQKILEMLHEKQEAQFDYFVDELQRDRMRTGRTPTWDGKDFIGRHEGRISPVLGSWANPQIDYWHSNNCMPGSSKRQRPVSD